MKKQILFLVALACLAISSASATIVLSGDSNIVNRIGVNLDNDTFFKNVLGGGTKVLVGVNDALNGAATNTFYNSLGGVTSSHAAVSAANLVGVDLFVGIVPTVAYTVSQLTDLGNFLSGGGTIFFMGENGNFPANNGHINNALTALGSSMSIVPNSTFDPGFHTTANIVANPLTAGVTTFDYAAPSQIAGGNALILGANNSEIFIAVEGVGNRIPDSGSTMALLGLGLAVFAVVRRRR